MAQTSKQAELYDIAVVLFTFNCYRFRIVFEHTYIVMSLSCGNDKYSNLDLVLH